MTQVFPISSATNGSQTPATSTSTTSTDNNGLGEDTFLKLLVAQLKYQDPMSPTDSTQFLTQTAQFTELQTLQKIQAQQDTLTKSSQVLAAATMVGRAVTYSLATSGQASSGPTPTSVISVRGSLPKDAAVGAQATASTDAFTRAGQKVPMTLQFTRTTDGWSVQAKSNGQAIGAPLSMTFDSSGDHTTSDLSIPASALNAITGTSGDWPTTGITLAFGGTNDPTRLQLASGPATIAVAEQNGNDGSSATGVVTGIHLTTDGPQLVIGGRDIPLASVTDVQT